jgi:putative membrane protein
MRWLKIAYLLVGLGLLAVVLSQAKLDAVGAHIANVGYGVVALLAIALAIQATDAFTWQMVLPAARLELAWFTRLLAVRLAGEAFNSVIPAAGLGGEPVKAELLNRHYAIPYRQGVASIVLARTVNMLTQLVFVAGGIAIAAFTATLSPALLPYAFIGIAFLVAAAAILFAIQRFRLSSRFLGSFGQRIVARFTAVLAALHDVEERFIHFYTRSHARFAATAAVSLANWFIGALEVWAIMRLLGYPVTFQEAWVIEATAQLVRSAAFLIPGSLGAQEGAFVLVISAIGGDASLGLAVAVVRRGRDLMWILTGFLLTLWYSTRRQA